MSSSMACVYDSRKLTGLRLYRILSVHGIHMLTRWCALNRFLTMSASGSAYAVRMARLRARIFGELVRKTSKE